MDFKNKKHLNGSYGTLTTDCGLRLQADGIWMPTRRNSEFYLSFIVYPQNCAHFSVFYILQNVKREINKHAKWYVRDFT